MFSFHRHQLRTSEALPFMTIEFSEMGFKCLFRELKSEHQLFFPSVHSCHAVLILSVMDPSGWGGGSFQGNGRKKRRPLHFKRFFFFPSQEVFSTGENGSEVFSKYITPGRQHVRSPEMLAHPVRTFIRHVLSADCMPDSQVLRTKCVSLFPQPWSP